MTSAHKKSRRKEQPSSSAKKNTSSSFCSTTNKKLQGFLQKIAEVSRKIEIIKEMLCAEQDFTPTSLFHRLDRARKGYLMEKDLNEFLRQNKVPFKGSQLKLLCGCIYSGQERTSINLREFQNFILPLQQPRLRYFTMRRAVYIPPQKERLSQKIEWLASKLFSQIMLEYPKLMEQNISLISSFDFNAQQLFKTLSNCSKFISAESLQNYLLQHDVILQVEELGLIVAAMDKTGEGRVHLADLKHYLCTLGVKRQHQIFDQLSPVPALKQLQDKQSKGFHEIKGSLYERYLDNKTYMREFENELARSRKSGVSGSRKY